MPICSCEEAGCGLLGGRNVDLRTQKQHMRVDQLAQFHRTRALSQPAFSEQHEEIMQWFASLAVTVVPLLDRATRDTLNRIVFVVYTSRA